LIKSTPRSFMDDRRKLRRNPTSLVREDESKVGRRRVMKTIWTICVSFVLLLVALGRVSAQQKGDNDNDPPLKMGALRDVGISADGKLAFAGDSERNIWVWDVAKRELARVIRDDSKHHKTTPHFAFSTDGKYALVGNEHGNAQDARLESDTLTFWDLHRGVKLRSLDVKGEPVHGVALSPDGTRALSVSTWKVLPHPDEPPEIRQGVFSGSVLGAYPPACLIALRLWDTKTGKRISTLEHAGGRFGPLAFSLDGKFIVSPRPGPKPAFPEKQMWFLRKWNGYGGENLGAKPMAAEWTPMEIWRFKLSPDGKRAAICSGQGVSLWNLETGKLCWYENFHEDRQMPNNGGLWPFQSVSFSSDGKRLVASGGLGKTSGALMIDAVTGRKTPGFITIKGAGFGDFLFAPGGEMLLGASTDGLRFWDAGTGAPRFGLKN
jgi:WD40 repeat protein